MQKPDGIFGVFEVVKDFYEHGIDEHLWVFLLMLVIVADIILGVSRAWAYHEFSSRRFRKGLVSIIPIHGLHEFRRCYGCVYFCYAVSLRC